MNTPAIDRPLKHALWNLRWLSLFAVGPAVGTVLVAVIFGMTATLAVLAAGVFLLMLALFAVLLGSEYRRIRQATQPPQ